ncbi:MAG: hypothetical protein ACOC0U_07215 [Desulfovibrionales bacterium]
MADTWLQRLDVIKRKIAQKLGKKPQRLTRPDIRRFLGEDEFSIGKIRAWEDGQIPSSRDLEKIGKMLDLSAEWLLYGTGTPDSVGRPVVHRESEAEYGIESLDTVSEWEARARAEEARARAEKALTRRIEAEDRSIRSKVDILERTGAPQEIIWELVFLLSGKKRTLRPDELNNPNDTGSGW